MAEAQSTARTSPGQPEKRRVTLDEYYQMLDKGYEVIDGELIPMTPQHRKSTRFAHRIMFSLQPVIASRGLGEIAAEYVFSFEIEPGTNWVTGSLVPDVAFINAEQVRLQEEQFPDDAANRVLPDLVIEVVSPSDSFSDVARKVTRYLGYGVKLVWVVDPKNKRVHVYTPQMPNGHILSESDILTAEGIVPDWSMPVKDIFTSP
jgi:Uma2 family endonuclease